MTNGNGQADWRMNMHLADEAATAELGAQIADILMVGDVIALCGGLGAGKTSVARAIIRRLADAEIDVPSPTFTLVQDYPDLRVPIVHYDLYRLREPSELTEIGFGIADDGAALLIEWAERAGDRLPAHALRIDLTVDRGARRAALSGDERWRKRLDPARGRR